MPGPRGFSVLIESIELRRFLVTFGKQKSNNTAIPAIRIRQCSSKSKSTRIVGKLHVTSAVSAIAARQNSQSEDPLAAKFSAVSFGGWE